MKQTSYKVFAAFLLVSVLGSLFYVKPVKATGTIYIHPDGTISPSEVPISSVDYITYTLIGTVYYSIVIERSNIIVDGAGYTIQGFGIGEGFRLYGVRNVTINNTKIIDFTFGIYLDQTNGNVISRNNITANNFDGIELHDSSNNIISGNSITSNEWYGVGLYYSPDNLLVKNRIVNNYNCIRFNYSPNNTICHNQFVHNFFGIEAYNSSDNLIFHNNFVNNTNQVYTNSSANIWDNSYPYGGNYWSNYSGVDLYCGSNQNETGGDGIGDTPYLINENNQDHYPLIDPWTPLKGDINRDNLVNVLDLYLAGRAYGAYPGHERWYANADVNRDRTINIVDIFMIAKDYGKTV